MGATAMVFEYKCSRQHLTEKEFPVGTPYNEHVEIICPKCLTDGDPDYAYLTFAYPKHGN